MITPCPRCEIVGRQGAVYKAKIIQLNIKLNICDECEAYWTENQQIKSYNFRNLTPLLKANGLSYEEANFEDLGYLEEDLDNRN